MCLKVPVSWLLEREFKGNLLLCQDTKNDETKDAEVGVLMPNLFNLLEPGSDILVCFKFVRTILDPIFHAFGFASLE